MSKQTPFDLVRWFSLISLVCIVVVGVGTSAQLSDFLTDRMVRRDAEVSLQFVQTSAQVQHTVDYFLGLRAPDKNLEEFLSHISSMSDVLRVNLYNRDKILIWSSEEARRGRKFDDNSKLDEALKGTLAIETGVTRREQHLKAEDLFRDRDEVHFVQTYLPIRDPRDKKVVGVVEMYRIPNSLFDTIAAAQDRVWMASVAGDVFLYLCLYWVVRRANNIIRNQQERLIESEALAAVGEMSGAIAHSIRNPLASIRTSAELLQPDANPEVREASHDIIVEVDRLEGWLRDLLVYSQPEHGPADNIAPDELIRETLTDYDKEIERRGVLLTVNLESPLRRVHGDSALLAQILHSLISNALDAMPEGGILTVEGHSDHARRQVSISIADSGIGIPADQIDKVFLPFYSTKQKGVGVGLALVKRVMRRFNGTIALSSRERHGTTVVLTFPAAG